jgi:hypothetical protein
MTSAAADEASFAVSSRETAATDTPTQASFPSGAAIPPRKAAQGLVERGEITDLG